MKKLPIVFPPVETYQAVSFVLAVLLAHEDTKNVLYNKYININGVDSDKIWDIELTFDDVLWDEYCSEGVLETCFYKACELDKSKFIELLHEKINQNCYICMYQEDDFYLSHSSSYEKRHFIHDIYIYGYSEDSFVVLAYKGDKLQEFEVPNEEILEAFFSYDKEREDRCFCTMKIKETISVDIDYRLINKKLYEYYYGSPTFKNNRIHGISVYHVIDRSLEKIGKEGCNSIIDIRVFRMLWEHKKIIKITLEKLNEKTDIKHALLHIEEIEKMTKKIFMLSLKFNVTHKCIVLARMRSLLQLIEQKDRELGDMLFK